MKTPEQMGRLERAVFEALESVRKAVTITSGGSTIDKKLRRVAADLASILEEDF